MSTGKRLLGREQVSPHTINTPNTVTQQSPTQSQNLQQEQESKNDQTDRQKDECEDQKKTQISEKRTHQSNAPKKEIVVSMAEIMESSKS